MGYWKHFLAIFLVVLISIGNATAIEQIPITRSYTMNNVIFDGKWTFPEEWKKSSQYSLNYDDGTQIELRMAHQGNFIYILVDDISETHFAKGSDRSIICFGKNDSSAVPDTDDYCFGVALGEKVPFVLQGGSPLALTDHFTKIPNPEGVIGISSVSDENDRYTNIPHPSYEFRIPTDLISRSDIYSFYLGVYDADSKITYSFPENLTSYSSEIPSPSKWGEVVSPDQSLPEFPLPLLALLPSLLFVIFLGTRKRIF